MFLRRKHCFTLATISLALIAASTAHSQQRFVLQTADGLRSSATLVDGRLTIIDDQGARFDYARRRLHDSLDRRYLGFYCDEAQQFVRWPVDGRGAMQIGTRRGVRVSWRRSKMAVSPVGGADLAVKRVIAPAPVIPHFGVLAGTGEQFTVATVDEAGVLRYYQSTDDGWQRRETRLREKLPPGAPLVLADRQAETVAYAFDGRGQLVEIHDGTLRSISPVTAPTFSPGAQLAGLDSKGTSHLLAVDTSGRLWQIDPRRGEFVPVESRSGHFQPGVALATVQHNGGHVFLVDHSGNLIGYSRRGDGWSRPFQVASGLMPGGAIAGGYASTVPSATPAIHLAAVDAKGRLRVLRGGGLDWATRTVGDFRLAPGSPVSLIGTPEGVSLSAVRADGQWYQWYPSQGSWTGRSIAAGFPSGTQVLLHPQGPRAFAIDRTGRLVAGHWRDRRWRCAICSPEYGLSPLLERRQIVPNPPLPPVDVVFENRHKEELVVRIFDIRQPDRPIELRIPPGTPKRQRLERDAGATLEEVYLAAAPGGQLVEEVNRYPLPPQRYYDVVIYANRVTSVYFDRTQNKTDTPDEIGKSLVSLGVFPIPPGDLLAEGERFDVYREAQLRRNPGAAAHFGTPGVPPR